MAPRPGSAVRTIQRKLAGATIMEVIWRAEKLRPTYDLGAIQAAFADPGSLAITVSAFRDAISLGFGRAEVVGVIHAMDRGMFIKSMTTFADHRIWQDVYHVPVGALLLYVKFQADVVTEFRVMLFKEK
jgi:motility quorum-sensing regulator/GCU-specific mRNA interferase toxin